MIPPWNALLPIDIGSQCGYHILKRVFNFFTPPSSSFFLPICLSTAGYVLFRCENNVLNLKHLTVLKPIFSNHKNLSPQADDMMSHSLEWNFVITLSQWMEVFIFEKNNVSIFRWNLLDLMGGGGGCRMRSRRRG